MIKLKYCYTSLWLNKKRYINLQKINIDLNELHMINAWMHEWISKSRKVSLDVNTRKKNANTGQKYLRLVYLSISKMKHVYSLFLWVILDSDREMLGDL